MLIPSLVIGSLLSFANPPATVGLPEHQPIAHASRRSPVESPASASAVAPPTIYYVSINHPTASDTNPGTIDQPFRSIQRAANVVKPGDIVRVAAGTYAPPPASREQVVQVTVGGTMQAPIMFVGDDNEPARLDAAGAKWAFRAVNADFVVVRGFEIVGGTRGGIYLKDSRGCVVEDNHVHDVRDVSSVNHVVAGIALMGDVSDGAIRRNHVHDCARGILVRDDDGPPITGVVIERNYVHDIHWFDEQGRFHDKNADGIVCNTVRGAIVRDNVIARCGDDGMDIFASFDCLIAYNLSFNHGDRISGSPEDARGDGNGIKVSTGGGGGHRLISNVCLNNERAGFDEDHVQADAPGNEYCGNVAFGNGRNGWIIEGSAATPTTLRANAAWRNNQLNGGYDDIRVVRNTRYVGHANVIGDGHLPQGESIHSARPEPALESAIAPGIALSEQSLGLVLDPQHPEFGRCKLLEQHRRQLVGAPPCPID